MAPILSFTADEVWRYIPMPDQAQSVHLTEFPAVRPELLDDALAQEWERLLAVREEVLRHLETARKEKRIGSAQEAAVELDRPVGGLRLPGGPPGGSGDRSASCRVWRSAAPTGPRRARQWRSGWSAPPGAKCPRCWNYRENVGTSAAHPDLCGRCADVLTGKA